MEFYTSKTDSFLSLTESALFDSIILIIVYITCMKSTDFIELIIIFITNKIQKIQSSLKTSENAKYLVF